MESRSDMTLGEVLLSARKASGISIEDLGSATSIRVGLLTEMENNDFSHCGGDVYARGHLRNIATIIGVDPAKIIELYDHEHSMASKSTAEALAENSVTRVPHEKRTLSWKVPAAVSLSILLVVGVVQIVVSNSKSSSTPTVVATESATPAPSDSASPEASPSESPVAPVGNGVTMKITATAEANIDIVVDTAHVFKGKIAAGESKDFTATTSISLYFSNAGAIDVTVNGENLGTLGAINQEVRKTFR